MDKQDSTETVGSQSDKPGSDPYTEAFWTWPMAEAWIMYRDPEAVRWAAGEGEDEKIVSIALQFDPPLDLIPCCDRGLAREELVNAMKTGDLPCIGTPHSIDAAKGSEIPNQELTALQLRWDSGVPGAGLISVDQPNQVGYNTIRFRRREVLNRWAVTGESANARATRRQRIDYSLIKPDAAMKPFWNAGQALLWLMYHDIDRVRALFNLHADQSMVIGTAMEPIREAKEAWLNRLNQSDHAAAISRIELEARDRYREACETIRSYGEAGSLVIHGRKNGEGDFIEISPIEWTVLTLESYPTQIGATAHAKDGGWPCYLYLTFEREALMRLSPSEDIEIEETIENGLAASNHAQDEQAVPLAEAESPSKRSTSGAKVRCQRWLEEMMLKDDEIQPKQRKGDCREQAIARFGISSRQFDRAWDDAIAKTGATSWSKAGPVKQISPQ